MNHFWQGKWYSDEELSAQIERLPILIAETLVKPWSLEAVLRTSSAFAERLRSDKALQTRLEKILRDAGEMLPEDSFNDLAKEIADFLSVENLKTKVIRELGDESPFEMRRIRHDRSVFESWAPLGFLVHVAPNNVFSVAALSAIEGLLTGNINLVKTSADSSLFTQVFFEEFFQSDETNELQNFVMVSRLSSRKQDLIQAILQQADGLAAWGGEEAISSLRKQLPSTARMIAWGHRLSFAYIAKNQQSEKSVVEQLAFDICALDQQACSSPQCVYLETEQTSDLADFAVRLSEALQKVSPQVPRREPSDAEAAEITVVVEKQKILRSLEQGDLIAGSSGEWRILIDHRPALMASPLYRTIWLKPLPADKIIQTLRPLRGYLQSVGLASDVAQFPSLTRAFQAAGALRIRPLGKMIDSYSGEPHDGEYALSRYCRRISVEGDQRLNGISTFSQIMPQPQRLFQSAVMDKQQFQSMEVAEESSHLFFKSGGSTGTPKISVFTYSDYHRQMRCAAEGLYAAGLDPLNDRCMNLFFGGGLYGGFISFFSVLEAMEAKQFPMSAHFDWPLVIDMILKYKVNVLLGMPSYLLQLFAQGGKRLAKAGVVKKVFYGGEHFTQAQKVYLRREFGVEVIRSASYGSVDAGPLGYQCEHCEGSVHHLHGELQQLEIVKLETDEPVCENEIGRLLFTSKVRSGQTLQRYEIGDIGRWVSGDCHCGRQSRRFELLGRHGDVFRAGGSYLNFRKWEKILSEDLAYTGEFQVVLKKNGFFDEAEIRFQETPSLPGLYVMETLLAGDPDLKELVHGEKSLVLSATATKQSEFERTGGSGKLIRVIDRREP
jgi:phenylacetate-coenzyme A ligase PaaK-like adenylate-forming protein